MDADESPGSAWPDESERRRWETALSAVAERELGERGVAEQAYLTVGYGVLFVNYGPVRWPVAGGHTDVPDPNELFTAIDRWVAFERQAGPGRLLDRDHQFIAGWRARLPGEQALWEAAAELVFADVVATTSLRWDWRIAVHEDEEVWPEIPVDDLEAGHLGIWPALPGWEPARRPLLLPQLWFEVDTWGYSLAAGVSELHEAVAELADHVQEQVMDAVWTAWPPCPGHGHPLQVSGADSETDWVCPQDGRVIAHIGAVSQG